MPDANTLEADAYWVGAIISRAAQCGMYGKLTVVMEGGKVRRVIKEESFQAPAEQKNGPGHKD